MSDPHDILRDDPGIKPLVAEHGELTLEPARDPFERLVVSIVRQQLSIASADAIRERLFERFTVEPSSLRAPSIDALADVGLSERKAETIRNVAVAFEKRGYSRDYFAEHTDGEVVAELTEITGIGPWTAKMFLVYGLGREDVFPVEDLGIRKGMWAVFDDEMDRAAMVERAERWRPYRSIASLYLWRVVD
ncbi:3-methyladenine DNA glycosylase protein [Halorhabdus tiamatea SARL4B]|uniref:3-methyladenine DNA glycosylase protein n=1 Tax=Halorhabdus tiamatea SARL4B TaxID=1033806 RepID=F7PN16_9EURY|nr:DNA-3-methyladenine glycosylase [Halorhabdus tiamatea]ERJ07724.1 3-methyladenine DNA glycosylase protein [Halorhabdus tiamatea SARL4B]CCQ32619.1 DNA-3-methyladenine glycosylase [Halorhabdus tiamatea SARL4B]